jgi:hypothetical protein
MNNLKVETGQQRYVIGYVLSEGELNFNKDLERKFIDNGFSTNWISSIDYAVVAEYPFVTMLSLVVAIWKVYPKLEKFIKVVDLFILLNLFIKFINCVLLCCVL